MNAYNDYPVDFLCEYWVGGLLRRLPGTPAWVIVVPIPGSGTSPTRRAGEVLDVYIPVIDPVGSAEVPYTEEPFRRLI